MLSDKKIILIIRDGWGLSKSHSCNFVRLAKTPIDDWLRKDFPNTELKASGEAVGLPKNFQGNSEVGHMTIGSGRVIFQSMPRIDRSIKDKSFFKIKELNVAIDNCLKNKSQLHIMGLAQTQGVHSHINHLFALLDLCALRKFHNVSLHLITDGRDAPPKSASKMLDLCLKKLKKLKFGSIATISGRYFAMDRDKRWDRTQKYFDVLMKDDFSDTFKDPIDALKENYSRDIFDEFIEPQRNVNFKGIKDNDSIIFFNFRTDRTRQITQALIENDFTGFSRKMFNGTFVAMTQYYQKMNALVAFPDIEVKNCLGDVISQNHLKQLRISETEKYAHVTFFFNGQNENVNDFEERVLVPSPKVATYDLQPEMSVFQITDRLIEKLNTDYNFIVANLVNADMIGHTGKKEAIIKGIEAVDVATGRIVQAGLKNNFTILITADHGNAECKNSQSPTSHTTNPVPFMVVSQDENVRKIKLKKGELSDIAPTILDLLDIKKPKEMTGQSLIRK